MKFSAIVFVAATALHAVSVFTASAALVTASAAGPFSLSGGGNSFAPAISDDGRRIAFVSHARNLVTSSSLDEPLQVFVRDWMTSNTFLVSVSTNGHGGDGNSFGAMLSSNGQFVVFASDAGNLVAGDTNGASDVFVRDLSSGVTRLVSTDSAGGSLLALSGNPLISADGQWVFFESRGGNVTAVADTNGATDVFARNIQTNLTVVVSLDATGTRTAGGSSTLACISADGRYVGFISTATDIAPGGTNSAGDLYRRDMATGERQCASRNVGSLIAESYRCVSAMLSANGRYAAFATVGTSNAVFRHDFDSDSTTLIALRAAVAQGAPQISADGRYVVFDDGTNVLRFDANAGTSQLVNVTTTGAAPASGTARNPAATPDGDWIVFISNCPDLVANSSSLFQIYARNMAAGITLPITVATNGQPSATSSETSLLAVAPNFSRVAFDSAAADLVADDGNRASDVFVRDSATETTGLVSRRHDTAPRQSGLAHAFIGSDCVSADGRFITFTSYDNDLLPGDVNQRPDVFIRDMVNGTVVTPGFSTNAARLPSISGNGRYVVYLRRSTLSAFDATGGDVLRFDRETGTNELVAQTPTIFGGVTLVAPAISSNGNLIAFASGNNLLVRDMSQQTNYTLASMDPAVLHKPVFTPDGRFLLFNGASGLNAWDSTLREIQPVNGGLANPIAVSGHSRFVAFSTIFGLYIHDLTARTNQLLRSGLTASRAMVALNGDGSLVIFSEDSRRLLALNRATGEESVVADPGDFVNAPSVSADGRFVVYARRLLGRIGAEVAFTWQIHVRDRLLGVTMLVSANAQGLPGNGPSSQPVLAADGRTVAFQSFASDFIAGDYNDKCDVFVLKLGGADTDGDGMDDDWEVAYFGDLSRNGTGDFDGDGASDLAEFLAGTDPTAAGSVFRVLTVTPAGGGATRLMWSGNPNRSYRAEFIDDLSAAGWNVVNANISWNGSTASITDSTATNSTHRYYRAVRLP